MDRVSRRNFLIRASALTASGATVAVPIIAMDDARAGVSHHLAELEKALRDFYPNVPIAVRHRFREGLDADPRVMRDQFLVAISSDP
jgi:hypothetical protein